MPFVRTLLVRQQGNSKKPQSPYRMDPRHGVKWNPGNGIYIDLVDMILQKSSIHSVSPKYED